MKPIILVLPKYEEAARTYVLERARLIVDSLNKSKDKRSIFEVESFDMHFKIIFIQLDEAWYVQSVTNTGDTIEWEFAKINKLMDEDKIGGIAMSACGCPWQGDASDKSLGNPNHYMPIPKTENTNNNQGAKKDA